MIGRGWFGAGLQAPPVDGPEYPSGAGTLLGHGAVIAGAQARYDALVTAHKLSHAPDKPRYYTFGINVTQCEGGYLVKLGDEQHVMTDLSKLGDLAVKHMATRELEK